ncbi:tyrosinase family protein [Massilia niastensis]|uniref:tyrosinase family protein n=1 Tax=Massilia niastensis TaxID=544911 RepID=UPI0003A1E99F|nr:tyrosinase family protein [Massilia niastensis]
MTQQQWSRRTFLQRSAVALGAPAIPLDLLAQTSLLVRPEWQTFKTTTQYDSLLNAVRLMKANTNSSSPNSWAYWKNIHVQRCPHNTAYFLAWHRGYLFYFERQLRTVSGDSKLVLPYWDYYSYSTLPAEFTYPSTNNPLYVSRRNTNVRQALTLTPFGPTYTNFQRGQTNAFEPVMESAPHNPIHNLIGNVMATMESPNDPIFWLHHANVDRLWNAWVAAGGGRKMPASTNSYWSGNHTYTSSLTMKRTSTYSTRGILAYYYQNEAMPASLPPLAAAGNPRIQLAQATPEDTLRSAPPLGTFHITGARQTSETTFALGGARNVGLDERSVSVQLPVSSEYGTALAEVARGNRVTVPRNTRKYRSAHIVLEHLEMTNIGRDGGFYYQVFLNLPANRSGGRPTSVLLGTLGAFEIAAAAHHGGHAQVRYPIGDALARLSALQVGMLSVSFVRVDGENSPRGAVIGIGEARLELSTEDASQ